MSIARASTRRAAIVGRRFASSVAEYQNKRFVPNAEKAAEFKSQYEGTREHAKSTFDLWRKVSIWVCIPALIASGINSYYVEKAHAEHREHDAHIPDEERLPEFEFQNIRTKKYFWGNGDKTLFWNDKANRHIVRE